MTLTTRPTPPQDSLEVDGDKSVVQLHCELADVLEEAIVAALDAIPGDDRRDHRRALLEAGVDQLDERVADVLATAAEDRDRVAEALDVLGALGSGHVNGQPSDREDVDALPALLAATTDAEATPDVAVDLGVAWASRPGEQRADVLEYLVALALGADVVLVASDAAATRLLDDHAADLPAHCLKSLANRRCDSRPSVAARVEEAVDSLNPTSRPVGVLSAAARTPAQSATYDRLTDALALDSPPYEAVRRLEDDHDLVERTESADGTTVVSLRPGATDVLEELATRVAADGGREAPAAVSRWVTPGSESGVSDAPQNSPDMPCYPALRTRPPDPDRSDAAAGASRPQSEAAAATDGDRRDNYRTGLVSAGWMDRMDWIPTTAAADAGDVVLCDADLSGRLDDDRDGRRPRLSYDADSDQLVVGAEYSNPMQSAVTLAHGLTSEALWSSVDVEDRIGDRLAGLEIREKPVLWSATCMGWLPSDVEDGGDVLDNLRDARDGILAMSGKASNDDSDVSRSEVTRRALGLVGTTVALFDLLGVDVVLEERVPEASRHFGKSNLSRRRDLARHLGMLAALTSRVGAFSVFRQLFEDREDRREDAFTPTFGAGDTPRRGSMMADIVVVGDGVEGLADVVQEKVANPRRLVDDAPDACGVDVDVAVGADRDMTRATARRMLRSRGLLPTGDATNALAAFASGPWSVATAVHHGLKREDDPRDVYLDECRRALAVLKDDQLVGDLAPSARAGVAALLEDDEPLTQTELADAAGISTQSWRNHREALVAAGIVQEDSDGWRICLPTRDERHDDDVDDVLPWWLQEHSARDQAAHRKPTDVLDWLAVDQGLVEDVKRLLDPSDLVGRCLELVDGIPRGAADLDPVVDVLEEWGLSVQMVLAGCRDAPTTTSRTTATMGDTTKQISLDNAV